jgi:8-hydroxy-5-deazaflavin:NADPH oxidoreductase
MRIAVIGAGRLGCALAARLAHSGHDVVLAFSRDDAKLRQSGLHIGVRTASVAVAVSRAEVVALAFTWDALDSAVDQIGQLASDKIIWDCTNPILEDFTGLAVGTNQSGAEVIAARLAVPGLVKGIPPFADLLNSENPLVNGNAVGTFVCGDNPAAKAVVTRLMQSLPSHPIDAGPLNSARFVEPTMMLLVSLAYNGALGPRIGLTLVNETKSDAALVQ